MAFLTGMGMAASMIVALGPQNAYLIKHGLLRHSAVLRIAAIYVVIDVALITVGALGIGALIAQATDVRFYFSIVAALFFLGYGLTNILNAFRNRKRVFEAEDNKSRYSTAILISVANPGVLFDTIVLVGGLAGQYEQISDRMIFSAGAATASLLWFTTLAFLSFYVGYYVTSDRVWRILDFVIGMLMIVLAWVIYSGIQEPAEAAFRTLLLTLS